MINFDKLLYEHFDKTPMSNITIKAVFNLYRHVHGMFKIHQYSIFTVHSDETIFEYELISFFLVLFILR